MGSLGDLSPTESSKSDSGRPHQTFRIVDNQFISCIIVVYNVGHFSVVIIIVGGFYYLYPVLCYIYIYTCIIVSLVIYQE